MLKEYVKLGFGFYIGYETAKALDDILGEIFLNVKKRLEKGY